MKKIKDAIACDGGKAFGLSKLTEGGFDVPEGFVIGKDDIEDILEGKTDELERYLSDLKYVDKFAVRSSACGEDGETNSYAGIFETKLNVENDPAKISEAVKYVFNSASGARVESYIKDKDHEMNVVVQKMISPVLAGVAFSGAVNTDGEDVIRIEAVEGLAENLVSGRTSSSVVTVSKKELFNEDVKIHITGKALDYRQILILARKVKNIADYFESDMDVEWCIDENQKIYFVQARPITEKLIINEESAECIVASRGYAEGTVFSVDERWDEEQTLKQIANLPENMVLVAYATDTRHMPLMKRAAAVITEEGNALSHAAIISRELGIPCITGYKNALSEFRTGEKIRIDTSAGYIRHRDITKFFNRKRSLSFSDIYDFDNIAELEINGSKLLFQPSFDGITMYMPFGTSSEDEETYEIYARNIFGCPTLRCHNLKYEWYFIYKNFRKLPYFSNMCLKLKEKCEKFNADAIEKFYTDVTDLLKQEVKCKSDYNAYDRVEAEEMFLSVHLLVDMLIPNGYAVEAAYFSSFRHLENLGITFDEMISGKIPHDYEHAEELRNISEFISRISVLRNEISTIMLRIGAITYDDLRTRNQRIKDALEYAGYEDCCIKDAVEIFYSGISFSEKIVSLSHRFEKLM